MRPDTQGASTRLARATRRHLQDVAGVTGVQVFTGRDGEWVEGTRFGTVSAEAYQDVLENFDPDAGGAIKPADGGGGWVGSYMAGGTGLDLALVLQLGDITPADLEQRLKTIEARVGWLLVAALSDRRAEDEARGFAAEITGPLLLDAAGARSPQMLADQWIARLERALQPDLAAVIDTSGGKPRLRALSGGGLVERPSDARDGLERLAALSDRYRAPLAVAADGADGGIEGNFAVEIERLDAARGLVLPVDDRGRTASVVVLLWQNIGPAPEAPMMDGLAAALSEAVTIQRRTHPGILQRLGNWLIAVITAVFGKTAWKLKLAIALIATAMVIAAFIPSTYQPSFPARIEASDRRVIAAPFDGVLVRADAEPGDLVEAGQTLVAMEDADLQLELARIRARQQEIEAEVQTARARRDTAQVRLLDAQLLQVSTELRLLERQIDLAHAVTSEQVIVVGGDARRRVGGRVRLGEALLEVADPASVRLLAFLDEDWMAQIGPGDRGQALLSAYPDRPVAAHLLRIGADPQDRDGVNVFPAWFEISPDPDMRVLDGMRGVVRIEVEQSSALAARTRGLRRWVSRTAWQFGLGEGRQ